MTKLKMIQQKQLVNPSSPVDPEPTSSSEGTVKTLVADAVEDINTPYLSLTQDGQDIEMTIDDADAELTSVSGTGLMTKLIDLLNDDVVNTISITCDGNSCTLEDGDTTSNAKSKILPIVAAAADGESTLSGLIGKTFTMKVATNDGDIEYTITVD